MLIGDRHYCYVKFIIDKQRKNRKRKLAHHRAPGWPIVKTVQLRFTNGAYSQCARTAFYSNKENKLLAHPLAHRGIFKFIICAFVDYSI